jgi:hypothetical protein
MPSEKTKGIVPQKGLRKSKTHSEKIAEENNKFLVYPNPAKNDATVKYTVPADCNTAEIRIYDVLGNFLFNLPISQKGSGQIVFDTMLTGTGVFLFTFVVDGTTRNHQKVVVLRE